METINTLQEFMLHTKNITYVLIVAALVGIAGRLIDFLVLLGLLVPPVAGVYLADFFVFARRDYSAAQLDGRAAEHATTCS